MSKSDTIAALRAVGYEPASDYQSGTGSILFIRDYEQVRDYALVRCDGSVKYWSTSTTT